MAIMASNTRLAAARSGLRSVEGGAHDAEADESDLRCATSRHAGHYG
jgi:hypothetical protein